MDSCRQINKQTNKQTRASWTAGNRKITLADLIKSKT